MTSTWPKLGTMKATEGRGLMWRAQTRIWTHFSCRFRNKEVTFIFQWSHIITRRYLMNAQKEPTRTTVSSAKWPLRLLFQWSTSKSSSLTPKQTSSLQLTSITILKWLLNQFWSTRKATNPAINSKLKWSTFGLGRRVAILQFVSTPNKI